MKLLKNIALVVWEVFAGLATAIGFALAEGPQIFGTAVKKRFIKDSGEDTKKDQ